MRFYHASSVIFPRNYAMRLFAVAFGAVHVPLLCFLVAEALLGQFSWPIFGVLLVATVVGSLCGSAGIAGMLRPIERATQILGALRDGAPTGNIPAGGPDMAGELLSSVAHAVKSTRRRIDALEDVAGTDSLTGLLNRRGFFSEMDQLGCPGGIVVMFDGDGFKAINDHAGHAGGDAVLRAMADRLLTVFGRIGVLVRWGGDEFLAYFPHSELSEIVFLLEQVDHLLATRPLLEGKPVTFSSGFAVCGDGTIESLEEAIAAADRSMYRAKPAHRSVSHAA